MKTTAIGIWAGYKRRRCRACGEFYNYKHGLHKNVCSTCSEGVKIDGTSVKICKDFDNSFKTVTMRLSTYSGGRLVAVFDGYTLKICEENICDDDNEKES